MSSRTSTIRRAVAGLLCAFAPLGGALALATEAQADAAHACGLSAPGHVRCLAEFQTTDSGARLRMSPQQVHASARAQAGSVSPDTDPGAPGGYSPATLHSAYNLPTTASGTPTVAVVDAYDDPSIEADLAVYSQMFGLPACTTANGCFRKLNQSGVQGAYPAPDYGWASEIALDVEAVHAICQNCNILLVEAQDSSLSDVSAAENAAVTAGADVVTNSFGGSEGGSDLSAFNHSGTVIVAAAGDTGFGTEYPASSPHVVAAGGTTLSVDGTGVWQSEVVWHNAGNGDGTGSGCSTLFAVPSWQLSAAGFTATGCATKRAVADVAADADPQTGIAIYDSFPDQGTANWMVAGGTSLSSPLIAGVYGLAGGAHAINYPGATPYVHQADSPAVLHDVTTGTNGTCQSLTICNAGPGYDGPTGVGTPNGVAAFVPKAGQTAGSSLGSDTVTPPPSTPPVTATPIATPPTAAPVAPVYNSDAAAAIAAHAKEVADAKARADAAAKATAAKNKAKAAAAKKKAAAKAKARARARTRARARARARARLLKAKRAHSHHR
jgi:hypothetical protein